MTSHDNSAERIHRALDPEAWAARAVPHRAPGQRLRKSAWGADDQDVRVMLWNACMHEGKYGDDGEMQCHGGADFRRDPLPKLVVHITAAAYEQGKDDEWSFGGGGMKRTLSGVGSDSP